MDCIVHWPRPTNGHDGSGLIQPFCSIVHIKVNSQGFTHFPPPISWDTLWPPMSNSPETQRSQSSRSTTTTQALPHFRWINLAGPRCSWSKTPFRCLFTRQAKFSSKSSPLGSTLWRLTSVRGNMRGTKEPHVVLET